MRSDRKRGDKAGMALTNTPYHPLGKYPDPKLANHLTAEQAREILITINILVRNCGEAKDAEAMTATLAKVQTELIARAVELNQRQ